MKDILGDLITNLKKSITSSDNVFIVAHDGIDLDAIGSLIGLSLICQNLGQNPYLIINDEIETIESGAKKVINNFKDNLKIIKANDVLGYLNGNDLLIAIDVNKTNLISVGNKLDLFKKIIVMDHHKENDQTIKTENKYIDLNLSSMCEITTQLLDKFNIAINDKVANTLLAGIMLDTSKFTKKTTDKTFEVASSLMAKGADMDTISNLFVEDYEHDRVIQKLVDSTNFFTYNVAVASDLNKNMYSTDDLAKAADYLLKYNVSLSFAIGRVKKDVIGVSARSKGPIDVSKIMEELGGGGNQHSAATKISFQDIDSVEDLLRKVLSLDYKVEEEELDKIIDSDIPKVFEKEK